MSNTIRIAPMPPEIRSQESGASSLPLQVRNDRAAATAGDVAPEAVQSARAAATPAPADELRKNDRTAPAQQAEPTREALQKAIESAHKKMQSMSNSELHFAIDDETGISTVKIVDKETGEVIRQIPSREMVEIAKSIDEMRGTLIRQRV